MVPPPQLLEGQLKDYFITGSQTCRSEWETRSPVDHGRPEAGTGSPGRAQEGFQRKLSSDFHK